MSKKEIKVKDVVISYAETNGEQFISLTDLAKHKDSENTDDIIKNWLRNRNTVELLGHWELIHNPDFNPVEFDGIKMKTGLNTFTLNVKKWIELTGAIGIRAKAGRYGGTFAHRDIAFEFASWISIEFKLYVIKEFQRLKDEEMKRLNSPWNLQRAISKINYRIHTDAIKENLIPQTLSGKNLSKVYANEADLLNVALFGMIAKEWSEANPELPGNLRDQATLEQLIVLSNLESLNAVLIEQGISPMERLLQLNRVAIVQMESLLRNTQVKKMITDSGRVEEEQAKYGIAS